MSFADEGKFAAFRGRDDWLAMTPEAVAQALDGFPVPLSPSKNMDWLAVAVRRALAITMPGASDNPKRTSNTDIRAELERLANLAESTWQELFRCGQAADARLWDHAWRYWDGEGGTDLGDGFVIGEPSDHLRFKAAVCELDWLAGFLRKAARETESQRGPWRQSEEKRLRVQRGQYLAPIFETAFGQPVTANKYPHDARHKSPTPFMDFYSRMVTLAFGKRETLNFTEVVTAACQLHRQQPVHFAEGIIPGL